MTISPAPAATIPLPASLATGATTPLETAIVTEVVDADTVRLDNHRQVRLVGTQGPKLPLGRPNYPTWPLAPEARAHLVALVEGQRVTLHYGGAREDRYSRILAHLTTDDGTWIQGAMLAAGFARVYTFADNRSAIPEMLALESQAREARRGI
jgi:endonuclease YncB( thermonuclease family)